MLRNAGHANCHNAQNVLRDAVIAPFGFALVAWNNPSESVLVAENATVRLVSMVVQSVSAVTFSPKLVRVNCCSCAYQAVTCHVKNVAVRVCKKVKNMSAATVRLIALRADTSHTSKDHHVLL